MGLATQPIVSIPQQGDRQNVARDPGRRPRFAASARALVSCVPSGFVERTRGRVPARISMLEQCAMDSEEQRIKGDHTVGGLVAWKATTLSYSADVSSAQKSA